MREILFRGKQADKWVYGFYGGFYTAYENHTARRYALIYDKETSLGIYTEYDSLGQFTGVTDRNGTKIFEGDIVKYTDGRTFAIRYSDSLARFIPCLPNSAFNPAAFSNCEIIGNIYDNPDWGEAKDEHPQ